MKRYYGKSIPKNDVGGKCKEDMKTLMTGEGTWRSEKSPGLLMRDIQMSWMTENFNDTFKTWFRYLPDPTFQMMTELIQHGPKA